MRHSYPRTPRMTVAFLWLVAIAGPGFGFGATRPAPADTDCFEAVGADRRLADIVHRIDSSNVPRLVGEQQWRQLLMQHHEEIVSCENHADFAYAVNHLIKDTRLSHFKYYDDEDWGYWHLSSALRPRQGGRRRHGVEADRRVSHIGVFPQQIDGRWFVRGIMEGSVADGTKIRVGDELLTVGGLLYTPIAAFRGCADRPTTIRLKRKPGLVYSVTLEPTLGTLHQTMQNAMPRSVRAIEHDGLTFAYLHGWTLLGNGREYDQLLDLQDESDGLLLDYRDGFGGTWDTALTFLLGKDIGGHGERRHPQWYKPVVILIADGTRSAKEIVVDAAKRAGRAVLVGTDTPGAVISVGGVTAIGSDGLLMLPGQKFDLEGHPTQPDLWVDRDIRYCAGADPHLAAGKEVLARLVRASAKRRHDNAN